MNPNPRIRHLQQIAMWAVVALATAPMALKYLRLYYNFLEEGIR